MFRVEIKAQIAQELERGQAARQEGFEGRARVCARRAGGTAVREYFSLRGLNTTGASAYDLLRMLHGEPGLSDEIHQAAGRLLERVSEDFNLPPEVDLLEDARFLADELECITNK